MEWCETICPLCLDDVEFRGEDCLLVDLGIEGISWRALFECPTCQGMASIRVPERVARALLARGFPVSGPHDGGDPHAARRAGPPLTWDDLLDFHELLERADWFDGLVSAIDQSGGAFRGHRT